MNSKWSTFYFYCGAAVLNLGICLIPPIIHVASLFSLAVGLWMAYEAYANYKKVINEQD